MSPSRLFPRRGSGERGFTLVESLVAMVAGLIVTFATFAILDTSLHQSSRIADRVSANQRGRIALEKILLELHSSCVAPEVTPIEANSDASKLLIVSQRGSEAAFSKVTLHEIALKEGKITDSSYLNTGVKPAPNWEFSATPTSTRTLLTGVSLSVEKEKKEIIPFFQYYKYVGAVLSSTPQKVPLTEAEANETAAISISFTAAPESGTVGKLEGDRSVDLADTTVLRFRPAATSGINKPCA